MGMPKVFGSSAAGKPSIPRVGVLNLSWFLHKKVKGGSLIQNVHLFLGDLGVGCCSHFF